MLTVLFLWGLEDNDAFLFLRDISAISLKNLINIYSPRLMQIPLVQSSIGVEKIPKYSTNLSFRIKILFPEPKIALCKDPVYFVKS